MFKFLRVIILLGLFAAVVGLGLRIYLATSTMDTQAVTDGSKLKESIEKTKRIAKEKAEAIREIVDSLGDRLPQAKQEKSGTEKCAPAAAAKKALDPGKDTNAARGETAVSLPPLNPVDAEDARLTAEVLNTTAKGPEASVEVGSLQGNSMPKPIPEEPFDFDRASKIQELYTRAAKVLDWD